MSRNERTPEIMRDYAEALALTSAFDRELSRHPSATLVLERWCEAYGLTRQSPAVVTAEIVEQGQRPASRPERDNLDLPEGELLGYRRVKLRCGDLVLSDAENWYVGSCLTEPMRRALSETSTSFGRVVQPLAFRRLTLETHILLSKTSAELPTHILEHRAVLVTQDDKKFSYLVERYRSAVISGAVSRVARGPG